MRFLNLSRSMRIIDAIELAWQIKGQDCSHETMLDYRSYINNFKSFLIENELINKQLEDFFKKDALFYLDYLVFTKKHEPITRNNNLRGMKGLFYVLKDREYVKENVFVGIKPLKVRAKRRKVYTKEEASTILNYARDNDKELLLAIYFCYYTALRRTELNKLKIGDLDLKKGIILVDGTQTKNKNLGAITIPHRFLEYLRSLRLEKYPANYFVLGYNMVPSERKCNTNTIPDRHRAVLKLLNSVQILTDIKGKSFYSWKDTCARDMLEANVTLLELQRHFRHSRIETTQRYFESAGIINSNIQNFKGYL